MLLVTLIPPQEPFLCLSLSVLGGSARAAFCQRKQMPCETVSCWARCHSDACTSPDETSLFNLIQDMPTTVSELSGTPDTNKTWLPSWSFSSFLTTVYRQGRASGTQLKTMQRKCRHADPSRHYSRGASGPPGGRPAGQRTCCCWPVRWPAGAPSVAGPRRLLSSRSQVE
jgi:hypothetical protein